MKHLIITEQKQQQNISPQLYQSLKILQMNSMQLDEYIREAVLENPVLEQEDDSPVVGVQSLESMYEPLKWTWAENEGWQNDDNYSKELRAQDTGNNLRSHLAGQFDSALTNQELLLLDSIIDFLDDTGYITANDEEISAACGFNEELVGYGIAYLQILEPAGVCARNLKECLCIQLNRLGYKDITYKHTVENHLEDIAAGRFGKISKALKCTNQQARDITAVIKSLHPKPGSCFDGALSAPIIPDIVVVVENNEIAAIVKEWGSAKISINNYYERMSRKDEYGEAADYLKEKIAQAQLAIKAVENRKSTLKLIADNIIEHQREFFLNKNSDILPVQIGELANQMNLHESTISRAISGKYLLCSSGAYPLRHFFSTKVCAVNGVQAISRATVKSRIQIMIDSEDKQNPLSDSIIVERLSLEGINLSRRVIAKYRSELLIPSTSARKIKVMQN